MKKIRVENAVGTVLGHDLTRIVPGRFKGVAFKKGHVIQAADIPELLKLGKRSLYVLELTADQLHEDDAALRICRAVCGPGLEWTAPREGKSTIINREPGLLKVQVAGLRRLNMLGDSIVSTLKNNTPCRVSRSVAATRIIPLCIQLKRIERLEAIASRFGPILQILPFRSLRVGAVVTGSEIFNGMIKDEFDRFVGQKVIAYGSLMVDKILTPDDAGAIAEALHALKAQDCDLILTTGGLSVDPDDVTRLGVRRAGGRKMVYGSPVLPGAMFLYAELGGTVVLGLPACVYYHPTTIFDLVLPRVLAGESVTRRLLADMGHGGLCLDCESCRFPDCHFGR
jgi:hypothetical protein